MTLLQKQNVIFFGVYYFCARASQKITSIHAKWKKLNFYPIGIKPNLLCGVFFGFEADEDQSYKDKSKVVCKTCGMKLPYSTCTTNMSAHINRYHYEEKHGNSVSSDKKIGGPAAQLTIQGSFARATALPLNSNRGQEVCRSILRLVSQINYI